jgi:two-component system, OmpR family, sensor kinase
MPSPPQPETQDDPVASDPVASDPVANDPVVDDPAAEVPDDRVTRLEAELAARDAFLAVAAHELRNPMTPILAHVQRLRRRAGELSPDAVDEALARIEGLVEGYVRRATTLLDVSRLAQGAARMHPAPVDVAALVAAATAAAEPAAIYAGSTIACEAPESLPAVLDRTALEQILDNLVSNAVKYGAGRPIVVGAAGDGTRVRITVRDAGDGISTDDQARIFDRFERAVAKGSSIGGFGVGLWVSSGLARAMGGSLTVESEPGRGSAFTLTLPVAPPAVPGEEGT